LAASIDENPITLICGKPGAMSGGARAPDEIRPGDRLNRAFGEALTQIHEQMLADVRLSKVRTPKPIAQHEGLTAIIRLWIALANLDGSPESLATANRVSPRKSANKLLFIVPALCDGLATQQRRGNVPRSL
jgi:hypothetical protein